MISCFRFCEMKTTLSIQAQLSLPQMVSDFDCTIHTYLQSYINLVADWSIPKSCYRTCQNQSYVPHVRLAVRIPTCSYVRGMDEIESSSLVRGVSFRRSLCVGLASCLLNHGRIGAMLSRSVLCSRQLDVRVSNASVHEVDE